MRASYYKHIKSTTGTYYDLLLRKEKRHQVQTEKTERWAKWYSQIKSQVHRTRQLERDRLFDGTRPIKRVVAITDKNPCRHPFQAMVMRKNNTSCAAFIVKRGKCVVFVR